MGDTESKGDVVESRGSMDIKKFINMLSCKVLDAAYIIACYTHISTHTHTHTHTGSFFTSSFTLLFVGQTTRRETRDKFTKHAANRVTMSILHRHCGRSRLCSVCQIAQQSG